MIIIGVKTFQGKHVSPKHVCYCIVHIACQFYSIMCDTKFSIYFYSVRFGIRAGGHVSLRFSAVGVFKHVFGIGFISRRVTKFACNFLTLLAYILQSLYALFEVFNFCFFFTFGRILLTLHAIF